MNRNDIHYDTYECRAGQIMLILRQDEEVWLSDLPPGIARRLREMKENSGERNLSRFISVNPADLLSIEVLGEVPKGTVLHSSELAPVRRLVCKTAHTLSETSDWSFRLSALGWMTVGVASWVFPPAAPIVVVLGKTALVSAVSLLASTAVEAGAKEVRKGYVRFRGRCIANLPPHKEMVSKAAFIGTMKESHYQLLREQMRRYSEGTDPLPQEFQTAKLF